MTEPSKSLATNELSLSEKDRLGQLESIVSRTLANFYDCGGALREIAEKKLYRQKYATFEEYCRARWNMSRRHAYRLMDASEVVENLGLTDQSLKRSENNLPKFCDPGSHFEEKRSEKQLRPLTKLPKKQQQKAWKMAIKKNPKPTAREVQEAVQELTGGDAKRTKDVAINGMPRDNNIPRTITMEVEAEFPAKPKICPTCGRPL